MARAWIWGYNILLKVDKKNPKYGKDETKEKGVCYFKLLNKTCYNDLILAQEDTVYF